VHGGDPYPSGSLLIVARESPIGGQKDNRGHVLSALGIADHTLRQAHDCRIVLAKKGLEGRHAGAVIRTSRPLAMSRLQPHHTY
jgi:hypothetical protein